LLQQSETFTGLLIPLTGSMLTRTRAGCTAMNEALAQRARQSAAHRLDDPPEVAPCRPAGTRHGRHELTNPMLTQAQVDELVERMLKSNGRRIDISQPFVDAMLPEGHRRHVALEGISRGFSAVKPAVHAATGVGAEPAAGTSPFDSPR
jgi:pilus assembly protein CpaF